MDYTQRRAALTEPTHPKLRVITAALRLRRKRAASFLDGGYTPVPAAGDAAEHLVAFRRGTDVVVAVTRLSARLSETSWANTVVALPEGTWIDRLSGMRWRGSVDAVDLFAGLPVALLARQPADDTSAAGEDGA